jgi:hypothetical protein
MIPEEEDLKKKFNLQLRGRFFFQNCDAETF